MSAVLKQLTNKFHSTKIIRNIELYQSITVLLLLQKAEHYFHPELPNLSWERSLQMTAGLFILSTNIPLSNLFYLGSCIPKKKRWWKRSFQLSAGLSYKMSTLYNVVLSLTCPGNHISGKRRWRWSRRRWWKRTISPTSQARRRRFQESHDKAFKCTIAFQNLVYNTLIKLSCTYDNDLYIVF